MREAVARAADTDSGLSAVVAAEASQHRIIRKVSAEVVPVVSGSEPNVICKEDLHGRSSYPPREARVVSGR